MYLKLIYYIITLNSRNMESVNDEDLAQVFYAAMRIKTYLDNALYLSSLLSDLSMFKDNHQIINDRLYRCTVFIISAPCSEHLQTTLSLQKRQLVLLPYCRKISYETSFLFILPE